MSVLPVRRRHLVAGGLAALPFLAGCAADAPLTAPEPSVSASISGLSSAPADYILPGSPVGSFGAYIADNSGRATTEFWDNPSSDRDPGAGVVACTIGHWAAGSFDTGCRFGAAGSNANIPAVNVWTRYWGDGTEGRDPSAFMFRGTYSYRVRLVGSYAANRSEVGWFRKRSTTYTFNPVPTWGSKDVQGAVDVIIPAGDDWGLYISNDFNDSDSGCGTGAPRRYCSDANGGFTAIPSQQHALFTRASGGVFLVGMEDNKLEVGPDGEGRDSDYQDYILTVRAFIGAGCSPGFWRNQAGSAWPVYARSATFASVFGVDAFPNMTLEQVLTQNGGGLIALGRHTVAALLNAATRDAVLDYELTVDQVIAKFREAFASGQYGALAEEFEALQDENGRRCTVPRIHVNGRGGR